MASPLGGAIEYRLTHLSISKERLTIIRTPVDFRLAVAYIDKCVMKHPLDIHRPVYGKFPYNSFHIRLIAGIYSDEFNYLVLHIEFVRIMIE